MTLSDAYKKNSGIVKLTFKELPSILIIFVACSQTICPLSLELPNMFTRDLINLTLQSVSKVNPLEFFFFITKQSFATRSNQAGLSWTPQAFDRTDYTIFIWEKKGWN